MSAPIQSAEQAARFMLAGKARITLVSQKTGARFTYRVSESSDGKVHFVSLLGGADNEADYRYFGFLREGVFRFGGPKSRVAEDAPSVRAFSWAVPKILAGSIPEGLEVWHEGRCGRCGRALTVPESIESGLGPECAKRLGQ